MPAAVPLLEGGLQPGAYGGTEPEALRQVLAELAMRPHAFAEALGTSHQHAHRQLRAAERTAAGAEASAASGP